MSAAHRTTEFVTTDGTRLAITDHGRSGAPATVVLAHGWTLDERTWEPVARALLAGPHSVRVLTYDHRGHGGSDPARPGTATIDQLADDLAELLAANTAGPLVLAGHSMGGMTIMALAERHPALVRERVVGAAFIATSSGDLVPMTLGLRPLLGRVVAGGEARLRPRGTRAERLRARPMTARPTGLLAPRLFRVGVRWLLLGEHPRRTALDVTTRCVADCRPSVMVDFRPEFDVHDRAAALAAFEGTPTVVLGGTRDRLTPARHSRAIAQRLPDARLVVYAGAGHMVPLERADQVAQRIGDLVGAAG